MNSLKLIVNELIKKSAETQADLASVKREISKKHKTPCPGNMALLKAYHKLVKNQKISPSKKIEELLITRPVRSLSGIVNISVLTKPYACPGKCLYCPAEKGIPKSYVSGEPAVERAKKLKFDPYSQVKKRIEMLEAEGHPTDKIELRIVGGTWSFYPQKYQDWFVKKCFDACNGTTSASLEQAQKLNEKARHKMVGLSVETRPDFINETEIQHLRCLGTTMVELGVQTIYNDVLRKNLRGHSIKETISATKTLKDAGFKVLYQMMPNLAGSTSHRDEKMFKELFKNPDFRPDLLKIYPCALMKEAPLYKLWKIKKYKPYSESQLIILIKKIKKIAPYYIRIQRIARDIPSKMVLGGGAKLSNLRQIILNDSKKEGWRCKCIRCREVKGSYDPKERVFLFRQDYSASDGKTRRSRSATLRGREIFLSFENKGRSKLFSLLRLRITSQGKAIIREIHTYGQMVPVSEKKTAPQHQGLGKKLIEKAEEIAKKEFGLNEISVISAIGAREYFQKLGYRLKDTYMIKKI